MRLFLSILLLSTVLFSSENKYLIKAKILEKIFSAIDIKKPLIVYSDNKELLFELKKNKNLTTSSSCQNATLLVIEDKKSLDGSCTKKPIFVLEYDLLSKIPQSFGAIFWKKGRPNIIIIAPRAKRYFISISESLEKYTEDKVW